RRQCPRRSTDRDARGQARPPRRDDRGRPRPTAPSRRAPRQSRRRAGPAPGRPSRSGARSMTGPSALAPRRLARTRAVAPFRHRNYRLFFGGQAISLVGTWMQQVAQAWLVLTITNDPLWLGIVAAAQFLPVMI